jgi:predicted anti-sigma-YlaC factor YlaD
MNHLDDFTLNEFLDLALEEPSRAEAQSHLRTCADCRARLEELQLLFTELENVPEVHLDHDLTPGILARLPRKEPVHAPWTRAFAAQLGVAIGFVLWLGIQIVPQVSAPQVSISNIQPLNLQTLAARLLSVQIPIPEFRIPVFNYQIQIFDFQLPAFHLQLSTTHAVALAVSTLLLWVVGNVILLKGRQEIRS